MKNNSTPLLLDIACGKRKKTGFAGVDVWPGADIVVDLENFPWPFEDESVDEVFCSHYIEHTSDLVSFANELYRIMKVGAKAEIIAPYYSSIRAWQDPTHLRAISERTFLYFNKQWRLVNKLDHYPLNADFDFECKYLFDDAWKDKQGDELKFAMKHYINVISDIQAVLTKRKPCEDEVVLLVESASDLWSSGDFDEAIDICKTLTERGEEHTEIYMMLAEYACKNMDYVKCIDLFRNALKIDDKSVEAHIGLVRALDMSGQTNAAQTHIVSIREDNPDLAELVQVAMEMSR